MDKVNLYFYTTVRGPGTKSGTYTYILEFATEKGPATLTKQGTLEEVTEHKADLTVLCMALERLKKPCEVTIYTESRYLQNGIEHWMEGWRAYGWINARGNPVANREEWEKAAELLGRHACCFRTGQKHSYREWIIRETEEKEKERRVNV